MRTGCYQISGDREGGDCLLPRHRREVLQELVEAVAGRETVEQVLHRDPRSAEDRRAPKDLGVTVDDRLHGRQG